MAPPGEVSGLGDAGGRFHTTHWSLVMAAGRADTPSAQDALEALCRSYWYPLYAYVRRRGHGAASAHDLVQGFFARLFEKRDLMDADRARGRFRSFLLASLQHFLANERERERAEKRGGGMTILSLDVESAEGRLAIEPEDARTPEDVFDRNWALVLLDRAMGRVRDDYERAGRGELFARLSRCLTGDGAVPYRDLASELEMSEAAFKVAVHRARKRFRECLRREIAETLADPGEVEDELGDLFRALGT
jgi:RNA polymerase sigma-70 factor (ECF subfamily)